MNFTRVNKIGIFGISVALFRNIILPPVEKNYYTEEIDWSRRNDYTYDPNKIVDIHRTNYIFFDKVSVYYDSIPVTFICNSYHFRRIIPIVVPCIS